MQEIRVSDAEREAVVARLRTAAADGRLEPDELEERITAALTARTQADLAPLTRDLPPLPVPRTRAERVGLSYRVRRRLAGALTADIICTGVWLAAGAQGEFWPAWVIFGTGVGLIGPAVHTALGVKPQRTRSRRSDGV